MPHFLKMAYRELTELFDALDDNDPNCEQLKECFTPAYYTYDGWNVVTEDITVGSILSSKYYVWGLDLSQSMQGAGGVGGLLAMVSGLNSYTYLYDGNGNVGQMLNSSTGAIEAHYEYDPYGNSVLESGALASSNPYRFSTKYLDDEYNLYYYGLRYYDPETGRWINRDPMGEEGGYSLYAFVQNNPMNLIDLFGQKILSLEIKGSGESIVHLSTTNWYANLRQLLGSSVAEFAGNLNLGFFLGKANGSGWNIFGDDVIGLFKFEAVAKWCDDEEGRSLPDWEFYASDVVVTREDTSGNIKKYRLEIIRKRGRKEIKFRDFDAKIPEKYDGPTSVIRTRLAEEFKNPDGSFTTVAFDAPYLRSFFHSNKKYRYSLDGTWRIQAKHNDNVWEAKVRLGFSFDDDANSSTMQSSFNIISPPKQIK